MTEEEFLVQLRKDADSVMAMWAIRVDGTAPFFGLDRTNEPIRLKPCKKHSWLYWKVYTFRIWLSAIISP